MAALQTLRNKAGVLITVIVGLALLAFVLTDFIGNGNNIFSNGDKLGEVAGEKIKVQDYQNLVDIQEEFYKLNSRSMSLNEEQQNQLRERVWQTLVHDMAFEQVYEGAGVDVTSAEILDMATGNHIAPILRNLFTNPQTGVYDRSMAENFLTYKNQDAQATFYWDNVEKELRRARLSDKYNGLLFAGIYCTNAEAQQDSALRAKSVSAELVNVRFSAIPDSTINVSKSEINNLYNKKKEIYKVDATRDIEYVAFPIRPSQEDIEDLEKDLESMKADFENPETDAFDYAHMNSDVEVYKTYQKESQLPTVLAEFIKSAKVNDVYGPYRDGNEYKMSRLVEIVQRPDSVKARHILITQNEQLADSLYNVLSKNSSNFAELARKYSEDQGSAINGGDLDWFEDGRMVPEFNEACFNNAKGAVVMVKSQFGTHIINVQDKGVAGTKYSIATIEKTINYSAKTHQSTYDQAYQFLNVAKTREQFEAAVDTFNLIKRFGNGLRTNQHNVNAITSARDIVKWAFKADIDEVSDIFEANDQFIVAVLTKAQEKGYAPVEEVSASLNNEILNEKKAAQIESAIANLPLAEVAAKYNSKVDSVKNVTFASYNVAGAGVEPALVGSLVSAEVGKIGSVKGNNAVYVYSVVNQEAAPAQADAIRNSYAQSFSYIFSLNERVVTDKANVEDNRILFY
ncbi:MAG: peptidylprolyl isomerase [Bacteroidales bacterium]|jgi:peptidyl-prolyl cis-trans isomerase D|nr:peptidylprolyl isomerase [Bacteroidales bacterium]